MIYGSAKDRHMARSILPAKRHHALAARKEKAAINRQHRRSNRQLLHPATWDAEHADGVAYCSPRPRQSAMVENRRDGDKLHHFYRWSIATTRGTRPEDRLSRLRAVLPEGLIGMHAASHLTDIPELGLPHPHQWWRLNGDQYRERAERRREELEQLLAERLVETIAAGRLTEFNRMLWADSPPHSCRQTAEEEPHPARLRGYHDIPRFILCYGHGLTHPYKGEYNPPSVQKILNWLNLP